MSSSIKIPKFCDYCGKPYIAQKTTTRYCSHTCNSRHYKQKKREEKVGIAFAETQARINQPLKNEEGIIALPKAGNHFNLREKEFLSVLETAELLGASRWTVQRMIKGKRLKVAKLGSRTIIKRADIDNLFN